MRASLKKKWVKALRSGEYKQGQSKLRKAEKTGDEYCCLGVLCNLVEPKQWKKDDHFDYYGHRIKSSSGFPVNDFLDELGLNKKTSRGEDGESVAEKLANMNDSGRWSFKKIAKWIEKHTF